ncbi:MAG: NupC/NupG family nucleoside CNT transporter [Deltaproteobacteria bacterium]|nr:NupC/NupG family nucleoside CNT transporter [Deltaproteobacteria bacterium]
MTGFVGIFFLLGIAFAMSRNRHAISLKLVSVGIGIQAFFALLVLKTDTGTAFFQGATDIINQLLGFTKYGASMIFGSLVSGQASVSSSTGATEYVTNFGFLMAFQILPTIIFFSALTSLLYHLGILQKVVAGLAWVMQRALGTSGAESLSASANIFVGQTEAPLLVRPFLGKMTQSELMAVMTGGFATVAGGVLAAYVGILSPDFPDIAGHLLAASVMSAPASLVMAKIMVPETETPETLAGADVTVEKKNTNVLDAISSGTTDGMMLAFNVGAMLISFVALVAMLNAGIGWVAGLFDYDSVTMQSMLGTLLSPLAWLLGVPWDDATLVGGMMGTKTILNEFIAYQDLSAAMKAGAISPKSVVIAVYALCGFSNLGSIGIQIGGLSAIAPERRSDLARLGFRAMIAASLACFQTAALAGILL